MARRDGRHTSNVEVECPLCHKSFNSKGITNHITACERKSGAQKRNFEAVQQVEEAEKRRKKGECIKL